MSQSLGAMARQLFKSYADWTKSSESPEGSKVTRPEIEYGAAILKAAEGGLGEKDRAAFQNAYENADLSRSAKGIYDAIVSPICACTVGDCPGGIPEPPVYACAVPDDPQGPITACTVPDDPKGPIGACTVPDDPDGPIGACTVTE